VDEIVKGPFPVFIHEHRFESLGPDRCIMHDTITYQWGRSWWGRLVSETAVRFYLTLLFKYRHHRTRKWALTA
jgi:ligand-binding SRPBCC domain-containing protein